MKRQVLILFTAIFLAIPLIGCTPDGESDTHFFEGDIRTLLLQETEIPVGWQFSRVFSAPPTEEVIANLGVVYNSRPTLNHMTTVINHYVGAFEQLDVAIERFDYGYQNQLDMRSPTVELPQKYNYKSPVADDFRVVCISIQNLDGLFLGYDCVYSARYGNTMSDLIVNIEKEDGVKSKEANLLSWSEVERLLKLIDKKFQNAGF